MNKAPQQKNTVSEPCLAETFHSYPITGADALHFFCHSCEGLRSNSSMIKKTNYVSQVIHWLKKITLPIYA